MKVSNPQISMGYNPLKIRDLGFPWYGVQENTFMFHEFLSLLLSFRELSHVRGTTVDRQRCTLWCATCLGKRRFGCETLKDGIELASWSWFQRVETPEQVPGPNRKDRFPNPQCFRGIAAMAVQLHGVFFAHKSLTCTTKQQLCMVYRPWISIELNRFQGRDASGGCLPSKCWWLRLRWKRMSWQCPFNSTQHNMCLIEKWHCLPYFHSKSMLPGYVIFKPNNMSLVVEYLRAVVHKSPASCKVKKQIHRNWYKPLATAVCNMNSVGLYAFLHEILFFKHAYFWGMFWVQKCVWYTIIWYLIFDIGYKTVVASNMHTLDIGGGVSG